MLAPLILFLRFSICFYLNMDGVCPNANDFDSHPRFHLGFVLMVGCFEKSSLNLVSKFEISKKEQMVKTWSWTSDNIFIDLKGWQKMLLYFYCIWLFQKKNVRVDKNFSFSKVTPFYDRFKNYIGGLSLHEVLFRICFLKKIITLSLKPFIPLQSRKIRNTTQLIY